MATELLARVRADIDGRLAELRPALAEYQGLLGAADALDAEAKARPAGKAAGAAASVKSRPAAKAPAAKARAAEQAIVAALEHGSHTVGELVLVTALSGAEIREGLRRLQRARTVARTRREGRAAYALSSATAG
jgi:hypothetical protein